MLTGTAGILWAGPGTLEFLHGRASPTQREQLWCSNCPLNGCFGRKIECDEALDVVPISAFCQTPFLSCLVVEYRNFLEMQLQHILREDLDSILLSALFIPS